jgi:hypothetical protein
MSIWTDESERLQITQIGVPTRNPEARIPIPYGIVWWTSGLYTVTA